MSNTSNPLAELTAMREKGEITPQEFRLAKQYLDEEMKKYEPTQPSYKMRDFWLGLAFIGAVGGGVYYAGSSVYTAMQRSPEEIAAYEAKKAEAAKDAAKKAADEAKREQERGAQVAQAKRRKHIDRTCMVDTNDTSYYLGLEIKARLRDPASYEPIRATWIDQGDKVAVIQDYRARSGFGGMNVGRVAAVLNYSDCTVRAMQGID